MSAWVNGVGRCTRAEVNTSTVRTPAGPVMDGASPSTHYAERWARDVWLWPPPPAGDRRVVCEWPDRDIPETSTVLDATRIRGAAETARPLWP